MSDKQRLPNDKADRSGNARESSGLDKAPDANVHRNASANDIFEVEQRRTNKSSGSLKEDSFGSVEIMALGHSASRNSRLTEQDLLAHEKMHAAQHELRALSHENFHVKGADKQVLASDGSKKFAESNRKHPQFEETKSEQSLRALAANDPRFEPVANLREHLRTMHPGKERDHLLQLAREQTKELLHKPEPSHKSELSDERRAAVHKATDQLLQSAGERFGFKKVEAMHVDNEDLGTALFTLLLGPDLCQSLGPEQTQKFGQNLLVFGIGPMFGAAGEAQKQFSPENVQNTLGEGKDNFIFGTAFGVILERCHPVILLGAMTTAATTFLNEQLNSPEHQARNKELSQMSSKIENGSSLSELLQATDRTSFLLGPEVFKGTWGTVSGGIGVPEGVAVGSAAKQEIAHSINGITARDMVANLGKVHRCLEHIFADLFGPRYQFAGVGAYFDSPLSLQMTAHKIDGPEPFRPGSHHPAEQSERKTPKQTRGSGEQHIEEPNKKRTSDTPSIQGDLLGTVRKLPQRYQMAIERMKPSSQFITNLQEIVGNRLDAAEKHFLKAKKIPTLPVHAIEDLNATPTAKACYEPKEKSIYIAEKVRSRGNLTPTADLEFDLLHEFAHALNWLLKPEEALMEGGFKLEFLRDLGKLLPTMDRQEAKNMDWLNEKGKRQAMSADWLSEKGIPADCLRSWQDIADHVLSDAYAHASGARTSSFLSNFHIDKFPDSVKFVKNNMEEWKKLMSKLEEPK